MTPGEKKPRHLPVANLSSEQGERRISGMERALQEKGVNCGMASIGMGVRFTKG